MILSAARCRFGHVGLEGFNGARHEFGPETPNLILESVLLEPSVNRLLTEARFVTGSFNWKAEKQRDRLFLPRC